jgi:hypothetical protein
MMFANFAGHVRRACACYIYSLTSNPMNQTIFSPDLVQTMETGMMFSIIGLPRVVVARCARHAARSYIKPLLRTKKEFKFNIFCTLKIRKPDYSKYRTYQPEQM